MERHLGQDHADVARIFSVWPSVAGGRMAKEAVPVKLEAGRLDVWTTSPVWAQEFSSFSPQLASRINAALGRNVVEKIRFSGRWTGPSAGEPETRPIGEFPCIDEKTVQGVENGSSVLSDERLRSAIRRAVRAAAERTPRRKSDKGEDNH